VVEEKTAEEEKGGNFQGPPAKGGLLPYAGQRMEK